MVQTEIRKIRCGECNAEIEGKIHLQADSNIRKEVLSGGFNTLVCGGCKTGYFFDQSLFYDDRQKKRAVIYIPKDSEKFKDEILSDIRRGQLGILHGGRKSIKVVFGWQEFLEAI